MSDNPGGNPVPNQFISVLKTALWSPVVWLFRKSSTRFGRGKTIAGTVVLALIFIVAASGDPDSTKSTSAKTAKPASKKSSSKKKKSDTVEKDVVITKTEPAPKTFAVASVVDGDTIKLKNGQAVRLLQIDAPESQGSSLECHGKRASTVLHRALPVGSLVTLQADPKLDNKDRYGRLLRYVFKGDTNINLMLVETGHASVWFYNGEKGKYANQLYAGVTQARDGVLGLWADCPATKLNVNQGVNTVSPAPPPPPPPASSDSGGGYTEPPYPPDVNCSDLDGPVTVSPEDPHDLDRDGDGIGCD